MNNNNNNNNKSNDSETVQPLSMANESVGNAEKQSFPDNTSTTNENNATILANAVKREENFIQDRANNIVIYDLTKGDEYEKPDEAGTFPAVRGIEPELEYSRRNYRHAPYMGITGVDVGGINSYHSQRNEEYYIAQKLRNIGGPTLELETMEHGQEQKFSVRNRIYVGNLASDVTKNEDLIELFKPYGEIFDIFLNTEKNFAFVKIDWHANGEKAKRELDGTIVKGRQIRVRFASGTSILRVSNLSTFVSNELLYKAFEIFGQVERAVIKVNDRGHHLGEGVVEFSKKSSASNCLRFCTSRCFLLTASMRPCLVEPGEHNEDNDGMPEKAFVKNALYFQERNVGPRFAKAGSVDHEYGSRWKDLHALYNRKRAALKREFQMEEEKLIAHVEFMRSERETEYLREELKKRESNNEFIRLQWELHQKQYQDMDMFRNNETSQRYQTNMQNMMMANEVPFRRRQPEIPNLMHDSNNKVPAIGPLPYEDPSPFQVFADKANNPILNNTSIINQDANFIDKNMMQEAPNPVATNLVMGRRTF